MCWGVSWYIVTCIWFFLGGIELGSDTAEVSVSISLSLRGAWNGLLNVVSNGLWSLMIVNSCPNNYKWKCSHPQISVSASRSVWEYRVSTLFIARLPYDITLIAPSPTGLSTTIIVVSFVGSKYDITLSLVSSRFSKSNVFCRSEFHSSFTFCFVSSRSGAVIVA